MQVADPCFEVGVEVFAGEVHDGAMLSHDAVSFSPPTLSIRKKATVFSKNVTIVDEL